MKPVKLQTIDECCGQPEGSFANFVKEQEEKERQQEERRRERIKTFLLFKKLAKQWRRDTGGMSVLSRVYEDENYKQILAMGPVVVPYIIQELKENPTRWFNALHTLTGENPAKDAKTFNEACQAWIEWGKKKHMI
jgi:hypothetical protein